jgi:apolipoprotein N-acyltransferase
VTWLAESAMLSYGWRRLVLLVIAGAVAALSAAPLFVLPALFVAMPVLVWCLDGAERMRGLGRLFGPAFWIGFAFGLGYFSTALHWLGAAFIQEGGLYLWLMVPAIVGLAAVLSLFWAAGTALAHLVWSGGPVRVVTLATFLAAAEYLRGHVLSGFPFDLLGYALTANDEMMQLASVTGVYGLTFMAALIGGTIALVWPADERGLVARLLPFFLAMGVIAAQVGYGSWRLGTTEVSARTDMKVRLVQPMILEHRDWAVADPGHIMDRLISLSETRLAPDDPGLSGVTHVVWPESVFPFFLTQVPDSLARIARMLPPGVTLLTGAPREALDAEGQSIPENPGYNSILVINSDGEIVSSYDKSHLVPFGEYLPLADFWRLFGIRQFVPGTNGWTYGDGRRLVITEGTPAFLALICYEAVFPNDIGDVSKAQFILNITNDAWFDGSVGPAQHAHHARIRSVETGVPMLRASNSGTTIVVDPLGRVTARLAEREVALIDAVPANRLPEDTFYTRFGDWPFAAVLALGLLLSLLAARRDARAPA